MHLDLRQCALALLPLTLTTTALAQQQAVYVDFQAISMQGLAPPSYGGGLGEPGTWDQYDPINAGTMPVPLALATNGMPSGVTVTDTSSTLPSSLGFNTGTQNIQEIFPAVNEPLFNDTIRIFNTGQLTFDGFNPGNYTVVTHSWQRNNHDISVTLNGGVSNSIQSPDDSWMELSAGETFISQFTTVVSNGQIVVDFVNNFPSTTQNITGIQIVPGTEIGVAYCPGSANSTGGPAEMVMIGSPTASSQATGMVITNLPQFSFGFPIFSNAQGSSTPMGSCGSLCVSGTVFRWLGQGPAGTGGSNIFQSDVSGEVVQRLNWLEPANGGGVTVDVASIFVVMAGESWNFQAWYRDSIIAPGMCSTPPPMGTTGVAVSNLTNGYEVVWQ